jgi:hypothetical protein
MVTEIELFQPSDLTPLHFWLWGRRKSEVYKRMVDTRDELLAHILEAVACINKSEDQPRETTCDLRTRVANCSEVGGGILEYLL